MTSKPPATSPHFARLSLLLPLLLIGGWFAAQTLGLLDGTTSWDGLGLFLLLMMGSAGLGLLLALVALIRRETPWLSWLALIMHGGVLWFVFFGLAYP